MDYKDLNDYELIYNVMENDEEAYNTLIKKYSFLVNKVAYGYYIKNRNIGIEYDDLRQEGLYAITVALKDYNPDNTLFYTYALLCIKREMERLIKYAKRHKQMILSEAVSLNTSLDDDNELLLEDVISSNMNVEDYVISEFNYEKLFLRKHDLKFDEALVYELKINKFSNKEIAILLDIPYKKVDNLLRNIRSSIFNYNLTL